SAGVLRRDLVAVGVGGEVELADRGRRMGMRRSRGRVGVGVVVGDLGTDRAVLHRGLGLVGDVVDRVVRLAERLGEGRLCRRGGAGGGWGAAGVAWGGGGGRWGWSAAGAPGGGWRGPPAVKLPGIWAVFCSCVRLPTLSYVKLKSLNV